MLLCCLVLIPLPIYFLLQLLREYYKFALMEHHFYPLLILLAFLNQIPIVDLNFKKHWNLDYILLEAESCILFSSHFLSHLFLMFLFSNLALTFSLFCNHFNMFQALELYYFPVVQKMGIIFLQEFFLNYLILLQLYVLLNNVPDLVSQELLLKFVVFIFLSQIWNLVLLFAQILHLIYIKKDLELILLTSHYKDLLFSLFQI